MAEKKPQTYANHRKYVPMYHGVTSLILFVNLLWSIWKLIQGPSFDTVLGVLMAFAFIAMLLYLRLFPLAAQDRVIRLEERLRMQELLPEDLRSRISELRKGQFVGLRFASDEELPDLVRDVLDNDIRSGEAIKKKIKTWRPDYTRF